MKHKLLIFALLVIYALITSGNTKTQTGNSHQSADTLKIPDSEKLVVLWTSGDREVALKMVFMYTFNVKNINGGMILHYWYGGHLQNFYQKIKNYRTI